ncbi:MAG: hypothetical protein K0S33_2855 [Bacteroidetes bacterium]|jgi:hypothetical protein|nr:hypothetical protein [Bacteroidota bacterium]
MKPEFLFNRFVLIVFAIIFTNCAFKAKEKGSAPDNDIGMGVIDISFSTNGEEDSTLTFFRTLEQTIPEKRLSLDQIDYVLRMTNDTLGICPLEFMPTPRGLFFRCLDSTKEAYHILVNENSGQTYWIRKNRLSSFSSWLSYLNASDYVFTSEALHSSPDTASPVVLNQDSCYTYNILNMKDDWIEVLSNDYWHMYKENPVIKEVKGWVHWRKGKKILIGKTYAE